MLVYQCPWTDTQSDCVVVTCSDHRFSKATEAFLESLGHHQPHLIKLPGSVSMTFAQESEEISQLIAFAIKHTGTSRVILLGHDQCGAYESVHSEMRLDGEPDREYIRRVQREHLMDYARKLSTEMNVSVVTYFAFLDDNNVVSIHQINSSADADAQQKASCG